MKLAAELLKTMLFKSNLHFHTADGVVLEKPKEHIAYDIFAGLDFASKNGFEVIALTLHDYFLITDEMIAYAKTKNILLIRGIEKIIKGCDVLILNCDKNAQNIKSFGELKTYKLKNPGVFVIAPHPYYYAQISLKEKLEENIDLFDAIESSWFYNSVLNRNKKAEVMAKKYNLPYVATSDTHHLKYLENSYALIEAQDKTPEAIFKALRERKFKNISRPARFWRDMVFTTLLGVLRHPNEFFKVLFCKGK